MSTSTCALPAHTTSSSQHEPLPESRTRHSPITSSSRTQASPASRAAPSPPADWTKEYSPGDTIPRSASSREFKNALRIAGSQSRDNRTVGPVPQDKKKKKVMMSGHRVPTLQTNGFPSSSGGSPLGLRTPLSARPSSVLDEIINGLLLPLPFLFASFAFPAPHTPFFVGPISPSGRGTSPQESLDIVGARREYEHIIRAGALSSAALLLVGTIAKLRLADRTLDRRKRADRHGREVQDGADSLGRRVMQIASRMLSLALPFYACLQLDGLHVALFLLVTIATGLGSTGHGGQAPLLKRISARPAAIAFLAVLAIADFLGLLGRVDSFELALGYAALSMSAFVTPPPFPYLDRVLGRHTPIVLGPVQVPSSAGPTPPATPHASTPRGGALHTPFADASRSILAGLLLAVITTVLSYTLKTPLELSTSQFALSAATLFSTAAMTFFSLPVTVGGKWKPGVASGLALVAIGSFWQQYEFFDAPAIPFVFGAFCAAAYFVSLSSTAPEFGHFRDAKAIPRKDHDCSVFTRYILSYCAPGSMLETILSERDSRRIAYFACLNLGFMFVQFFYGFLTGSLGLLTDSIHMLFDCLGLAVGLAAAVMSKWPPTLSFPYGYGRIDTLSGFANGIFLMLVSIEIVTDAMHRLHEGHELRHLNELLVVSILGFAVNIIGLTAFGHAHHGHGHSHGDNHGHGHSHTDSQACPSASGHTTPCEHGKPEHIHNHGHHHHHHHHHEHAIGNGHAKHEKPPSMPQTPFSIPSAPLTPSLEFPVKHGHGHSHDNENMQGIFLHVLADTLGSVAVIISTLLTKYDGWSGWDPLASCGIAILIFLSAIPLVKQSGLKLLLALPNEIEYSCRDALQGLSELRGIVGYAGVRVWQEERCTEASGHHHHHSHNHEGHEHKHKHGHRHEHSHSEDDHHRAETATLSGVIHVIAAPTADLEDVGERASQYLMSRDLDLVVHVERDGSGDCWCGGGTRPG